MALDEAEDVVRYKLTGVSRNGGPNARGGGNDQYGRESRPYNEICNSFRTS